MHILFYPFKSVFLLKKQYKKYMELNAGNILFLGSILLFISVVAGKAGYRFGVPALLLFLGVGMLFGRRICVQTGWNV